MTIFYRCLYLLTLQINLLNQRWTVHDGLCKFPNVPLHPETDLKTDIFFFHFIKKLLPIGLQAFPNISYSFNLMIYIKNAETDDIESGYYAGNTILYSWES